MIVHNSLETKKKSIPRFRRTIWQHNSIQKQMVGHLRSLPPEKVSCNTTKFVKTKITADENWIVCERVCCSMETHRKLNERFVWWQRLQQTKRIDSSRRTAAFRVWMQSASVWNENKIAVLLARSLSARVFVCRFTCSTRSVRWLLAADASNVASTRSRLPYSIRFVHVFVNGTSKSLPAVVIDFYHYTDVVGAWVCVRSPQCIMLLFALIILLLFRWSILWKFYDFGCSNVQYVV